MRTLPLIASVAFFAVGELATKGADAPRTNPPSKPLSEPYRYSSLKDASDAETRLAEARKQVDQTTTQQTAAEQQLNALQKQAAEARTAADAATASRERAQNDLQQLQQQVAQVRSEVTQSEARLASLRQAAKGQSADPAASTAEPSK